MGRFINADSYASTGQGILGNNMFAYCQNNPVSFSDPSGKFLVSAILIGMAVGAIAGGVIGGVISYNSAIEAGAKDTELLLETLIGAAKGMAIGGIAGSAIGMSGGLVVAYGATSVAGTAAITFASTATATAVEVATLQFRKSRAEGMSSWKSASNCIDALIGNGIKVIKPAFTKTATTSACYLLADISQHKVIPLGFSEYLRGKGGALAYGFSAVSVGCALYAMVCNDPIGWASDRGIDLV